MNSFRQPTGGGLQPEDWVGANKFSW